MRLNSYRLIIIILLSLCTIAVIAIYPLQQEEEVNEQGSIIAVVNGSPILESDSHKSSEIVNIMHMNQLSNEQLKKEIQRYEMNKIINQIRRVIIEQQIKKRGIVVNKEEVLSEIEDIFEKGGINNQIANEIVETSNAIYKSLQEWQKEPSKSDLIYKENLANKNISETQWELHKIIYDSPEKLKKMEIPKNVEDLKSNTFESTKDELLYQKLIDDVTKDIKVTEDEIKQIYNDNFDEFEEKPAFDQVKDEIRESIIVKRKEDFERLWWKQQYRQINIEIKDPNYEYVLDVLLSEDSE